MQTHYDDELFTDRTPVSLVTYSLTVKRPSAPGASFLPSFCSLPFSPHHIAHLFTVREQPADVPFTSKLCTGIVKPVYMLGPTAHTENERFRPMHLDTDVFSSAMQACDGPTGAQ